MLHAESTDINKHHGFFQHDDQLELHPKKTKTVYLQYGDRKLDFPVTSFDFLGNAFHARQSNPCEGKYFINFSPTISNKAVKRVRQEIKSWQICCRFDKNAEDLAKVFNSIPICFNPVNSEEYFKSNDLTASAMRQ